VEAIAAVHDVEPSSEDVPAGHGVHWPLPVVLLWEPTAQSVHAVDDPSPKVPAGHGVHPAAVADGAQYVPVPQHTVDPDVVHWLYVIGGWQPPVLHRTAEPLAAKKKPVLGTHPPGPGDVLAGQGVHALEPAALEVPWAHCVHADALPRPKVPTEQVWQAVESPPTKNVPPPQHTGTPAAVQCPCGVPPEHDGEHVMGMTGVYVSPL
jgi:hypothetical protein